MSREGQSATWLDGRRWDKGRNQWPQFPPLEPLFLPSSLFPRVTLSRSAMPAAQFVLNPFQHAPVP